MSLLDLKLTKAQQEAFPAFNAEARRLTDEKIAEYSVFYPPDGTFKDRVFRKEESEFIHAVFMKDKRSPKDASSLEVGLLCIAQGSIEVGIVPSAQPMTKKTKAEMLKFARALHTIGNASAPLLTELERAIQRKNAQDDPYIFNAFAAELEGLAEKIPVGQGKGAAENHHICALLSDFYSEWKGTGMKFSTSKKSRCYGVAHCYLRLCGFGHTNFEKQMKLVKDKEGKLNYLVLRE